MTAKIAKQRLIAVLAEDHAERRTRPITARDLAVRAIEVLSDDGLSGQMARTTLSLGFGQDRALEVGRAIKFAERFRQ